MTAKRAPKKKKKHDKPSTYGVHYYSKQFDDIQDVQTPLSRLGGRITVTKDYDVNFTP